MFENAHYSWFRYEIIWPSQTRNFLMPGSHYRPVNRQLGPLPWALRIQGLDLIFCVCLIIEPRYDYLSINDEGLLTPNSTVNSITADYTRQMILSQNRRNNTDLIASECLPSSPPPRSPRPALAEKQGELWREFQPITRAWTVQKRNLRIFSKFNQNTDWFQANFRTVL